MRRALRFVDGNFNTPCLALEFGANDDAGAGACDELLVHMSTKCILEVGVPISDDENDEDSGVCARRIGKRAGRYSDTARAPSWDRCGVVWYKVKPTRKSRDVPFRSTSSNSDTVPHQ